MRRWSATILVNPAAIWLSLALAAKSQVKPNAADKRRHREGVRPEAEAAPPFWPIPLSNLAKGLQTDPAIELSFGRFGLLDG